jgi:cystathionine beta-lyase/cystathionine gamma-synthase
MKAHVRFGSGEPPFAGTSLADDLCPRAGQGEGDGAPLVAPLVQSTSFCRAGVESSAEDAYSRVSNPTVRVLERALGELERARPAACFASGLAAETALFLALLRAGDHVVCGRAVYGGTTRLLQNLLAGLGIETTFADATRIDAVERAVRPATKLIFVETPANPTLELTDIAAVARVARESGALLAVDNTFLTAVLQEPLEWGADLSVYSTTKFIDGHSAALGGAIVSRDEALLERIRFVRKCIGGIQTPFNAWLTVQGLKTLPLRIRRQSESAAAIARALAERRGIERVYYPDLAAGQAALARKQHAGWHGAVVTFEIAGGLAAARGFLARLRLCRLAEHVGSVETLVTHPATMTHLDVPREQRERAGVTDGLVRLSVGLEDPGTIIADLDQALAGASAPRAARREEVAPCCAIR